VKPDRITVVFAYSWALVGAGVAWAGYFNTQNPWVLLAVASVGGPLAAAVGARLILRRERWAGAALLLSVATPTYFLWPLNAMAFVVGSVLLFFGSHSLRGAERS
jgi:hypothetical protein